MKSDIKEKSMSIKAATEIYDMLCLNFMLNLAELQHFLKKAQFPLKMVKLQSPFMKNCLLTSDPARQLDCERSGCSELLLTYLLTPWP
jgi:hypothetical protein